MKKSIKKNYLYNLMYQLLAIVLPVITTPYLARTLGASGTGTYSYTVSIVTYFILFGSLGLGLYGQREIAYNQNNEKNRSKIFWELFILKFITLSISSIIFYFTFARVGDYSLYYKILLLELFANAIDISWFFQGIEEFKKIVIRNLIIRLLSILFIFLLIKGPGDIAKYIFIFVLNTFLGNATLWFKINKYVSKVKVSDLNVFRHIKPTLVLFIPQIAIQIYTVLDKTMIGVILDDMSEVGFYEQAQKIVKILMTIITSMGTVMLPRIANCFAEGDNNQIKKYMNKTFNFVFFLAFSIIFGIIAVSNNFVPLFFGKGYDKVVGLMSIMSLIILFIGLSNIIGNQYLLPTKRQKEYTISVIAGACINFILNYFLIKNYMSYGAAIATVIAEFLVMMIQIYFVRKDLDIKKLFSLSRNYLISGIIMFIATKAIDLFSFGNFVSLILKVIVGCIVYVLLLLFAFKDKFLYQYIKTFKSKIGK